MSLMFAEKWQKFKTTDYKFHLALAFLVRLIFILYGIYHDGNSVVQYTDIDYKVFTDASRYILHNKSPYDRHTYRYTPLIAFMLIPNILVQYTFGKVLFCVIDLIVGLLIHKIVKTTLGEYECFMQKSNNKIHVESNAKTVGSGDNNHFIREKQKIRRHNVRQRKRAKTTEKYRQTKPMNAVDVSANISMLIWLYNPMTIAIATRGNCDSIAGLLVLVTLYLLQCRRAYFLAGIFHGLSIHVRLYPIAYSLAFFMYLSKFSFYSTDYRTKSKTGFGAVENVRRDENGDNRIKKKLNSKRRTIFNKKYLLYLIPNTEQISLICGCLLSMTLLTALFYYLYGYKFLYETYIYHLTRKDTRHNFSLYFYLQYLTAGVKDIGLWQKVLTVLPQLALLVVFSVRYGLNKISLNFCILTQTIVMVTFNSVLTSQYFVWIMAVLPLCVWQIQMSLRSAVLWTVLWIVAQAAWLLPAYLLEFRGQNTFLHIWVQSVAFFCANIAILGRLIMNFMPCNKRSIS